MSSSSCFLRFMVNLYLRFLNPLVCSKLYQIYKWKLIHVISCILIWKPFCGKKKKSLGAGKQKERRTKHFNFRIVFPFNNKRWFFGKPYKISLLTNEEIRKFACLDKRKRNTKNKSWRYGIKMNETFTNCVLCFCNSLGF